jgi:hypothetical protein
MVDEMDWKAAMNSEVFRTFVANELKKEADAEAQDIKLIREFVANQIRSEASAIKEADAEINAKNEVFSAFDEFEAKIKKSPELLQKFKMAKKALISNPDLIQKVDEKFVNGIMMMDLDEEK